MGQPALVQASQERDEILEIAWLGVELPGAHSQGHLPVRFERGGGKQDDWQATHIGTPFEPGQHVKAVQLGHFQIEEQQVWKRVPRAVIERRFAAEIINDNDAITDIKDTV